MPITSTASMGRWIRTTCSSTSGLTRSGIRCAIRRSMTWSDGCGGAPVSSLARTIPAHLRHLAAASRRRDGKCEGTPRARLDHHHDRHLRPPHRRRRPQDLAGRGLVHRTGGAAVSAPAGRPAAVGAGLLAKLLAAVRPEFRVEVYVPAPDDPVLGGPSCVVPGCDRSGWEYGLCGGHSHRWRSRGRPDLVGFLTDPGPAKRPMKLDVELSKLELSKDVAAMANTTAGG